MSANIKLNSRSNLPHRQPPTLLAYIVVPAGLLALVTFLAWLVIG